MKTLQLPDCTMAYDDAGTGTPVVVLLHGYPFNRSLWREQVADLAKNWRVLTPDLRGLGASRDAATTTATMAQMAQDVIALLDALKVQQAVIGGLSMGGYVTLELARQFPERVAGLILADTKASADNDTVRAGRYTQADLVINKGMAAMVDDFLPKALSEKALTELPEAVAQVREMILTTEPNGAAAAQRGMAARREHLTWLSAIKVPTLIIVGSADKLTTPADAAQMHAAISEAELVTLEGAGHVSNLEQPTEFNRVVREFLLKAVSHGM